MSDLFDLVVIGAGPGGHALAEASARLGARVAIIENNLWGGTCTHRGCVPTKALLACSGHYAHLKKLKRFGIDPGVSSFDFAAMKRHQQQMTRISALGVEKSLREAGVLLMTGEGSVLAPGEIQCTDRSGNGQRLLAKHVAICWGSEPQLVPGAAPSQRVLTSDGFLQLDTLPESMLIVGGSVIGVEFATFLAELNVRVTLIELLDRILPCEEEEASALLTQALTRLGVVIRTSAKLKALSEASDRVHAVVTCQGRDADLTAACALICTGRKPRLRVDELDRLGIHYDQKGISVDADGKTGVPGLYAIGDVTGGLMLAHRAMHQGKALASRLFGDGSVVHLKGAVPSVVYAHPQIARVGLTEKQARIQGMDVAIEKSDYGANIIARTELAGQGFVKTIYNKDQLIGVTIAGDGAADLIAPMSLTIANGMGRRELKRWIIPHPTLSEVLTTS